MSQRVLAAVTDLALEAQQSLGYCFALRKESATQAGRIGWLALVLPCFVARLAFGAVAVRFHSSLWDPSVIV